MATATSMLVLVAVLVMVAWGRVPDLAVTFPAALAVLALGLVDIDAVGKTMDSLAPTLAFLAAILVIGEVARAADVFGALGALLDAHGRGSAGRVVVVVSLGAIAVTALMSLDATAVLFTPVVLLVVDGLSPRAVRDQPLLATAHLANASSGMLPVSNLTNLIVFSATGLTFGGYTLRMALPTLAASAVVVAVAWGRSRRIPLPAAARGTDPLPLAPPITPPAITPSAITPPSPARAADAHHTSDLAAAPDAPDAPGALDALDGFAWFVLAAIAAMVVAFFVVSQLGGEPAWVAAVTAVVLADATVITRRDGAGRLLAASSPQFLVFVAALAVVVRAAVDQGLGDVARSLLPDGGSLPALLTVVVLAAVLANLVNNLPATLVLLVAIGPGAAHVPQLLAVLVGVNIGPNLTYTGSLATLLWRRIVRAAGAEPRPRSFFVNAWLSTPLALLLATVCLWVSLRLFGT